MRRRLAHRLIRLDGDHRVPCVEEQPGRNARARADVGDACALGKPACCMQGGHDFARIIRPVFDVVGHTVGEALGGIVGHR